MSDVGKIKNISGEGRTVSWLGGRLVHKGQVVEVPVDDVPAYTCQLTIWEPADAVAKAAHKKALEEPAAPADPNDTPAEG